MESFEPSKPWEPRLKQKKTKQKNPQDYDGPELESLLFREFLKARFLPRYSMRLVTAVPVVPLMFFFATRNTGGYLT